MKKPIVALTILCALVTGCDDPLARSEMTLTFDETGEQVAISVRSGERHLRLEHAADGDRHAEEILAARDEWSLRFAAAKAGHEKVTFGRSGRTLKSVEHQASVGTSDLSRFFFDVGVTVQFSRGDDWAELAMYPGDSTRATRRQREVVEKKLREFASLGTTYFTAVRNLYAYLAANPERAEEVFYGIYAEENDEKPRLSELEAAHALAVRKAAEALMASDNEGEKDTPRLIDLAYNPFPAVVTVRVPSAPLAVEGFEAEEEGRLIASTATPFDALMRLEGRWVSPDPLAAILRTKEDLTPRQFAARIAAEPRQAAPVVVASDILEAVIAGIRPSTRYRVRWEVKPVPPKEQFRKPAASF